MDQTFQNLDEDSTFQMQNEVTKKKGKQELIDDSITEANQALERLKLQGKNLETQVNELKQEIHERNPEVIQKYEELVNGPKDKDKDKNDEKPWKPLTKNEINKKLQEQKKNRPPMPSEEEDLLIKQMEKEIKNAENQKKQYEYELNRLKTGEADPNAKSGQQQKGGAQIAPVQKIFQYENELIQKDKSISILEQEIKNLEKIKRDQEKQIGSLTGDSEVAVKVNEMTKEAQYLQEKILKLEKTMKEKEDMDKKRDDLIKEIQDKCAKIKIEAPKLNVQQPQLENSKAPKKKDPPAEVNSEEELKKKIKEKWHISKPSVETIKKEKDNYDKLEKNPQNYADLKLQLKSIIKINLKMKKDHEVRVSIYNDKIAALNKEAKNLENKIKEKEKEQQLIEDKIKELSKMKRKNQLKPMEEKQTHKKNVLCNTDKRGTQRVVLGSEINPDCLVSDDVIVLGEKSVQHRIIQICIFSEKNKIFGLNVLYINEKNEKIEGMCQVNSQVKQRCVETKFEVDKTDKISKIEGSYNEAIDYVKIITKDNKEVKVGVSSQNSKKFNHEFQDNEIPITLFAGFDLCKDSNNPNELQMVFLGIEYLDENKQIKMNEENVQKDKGGNKDSSNSKKQDNINSNKDHNQDNNDNQISQQ